VFTRDEAVTLISDPRIPLDRRVVYAFGLLAGLRPGEAAALRWRHYDATTEPLGRLLIATAYNTKRAVTKRTKTETTKSIPVHPTLATLLTEWRASGWAAMVGREPQLDDLIVPLPPATVEARTRRSGEPFRGYDYSGKRWRETDLPMLGWRSRSLYDTKSTFITLSIEDGADPTILRDRVTHTKQKRSAFDGYDRGPHWEATCREISKLRISLRREFATGLATIGEKTNRDAWLDGSGGGFRSLAIHQ
jgi:integrase